MHDWGRAARALPHDVAGSAATGESIGPDLVSLLDHYEQSLFAFLIVLLGDRDAARDCTQETFARAFENLRKGKPVGVQWLYKVARNRAMDEFRRRRREVSRAEPLDQMVAEVPKVGEEAIAVRRALLRLSSEDREVLYLAEVDGFTSVEIGEMLGVRPGAVRMRLYRAHLRFKRVFGGGE